jgi:hypothetical protein
MSATLQELAPQAPTNQEDDDGGAVTFSIDDPGIYDAEGCIEFIDEGNIDLLDSCHGPLASSSGILTFQYRGNRDASLVWGGAHLWRDRCRFPFQSETEGHSTGFFRFV